MYAILIWWIRGRSESGNQKNKCDCESVVIVELFTFIPEGSSIGND